MRKLIVIIILLTIIGFLALIYTDTKNVAYYWNTQIEITNKDSLFLIVTETNYLRGNLSFNQKYFIVDAKISDSNIELWEVSGIELPFIIKKKIGSDTLQLNKNGKLFFFILDSN